ncbi:MAG: hypothetical protein MAG551_00150 [Candidatus Scalindua arabica]|uniref:Uncharacterized protein n=1 Tax=Candidatus Scalindua arabica TaxID=1127984 RepID=A0A941ZYD4_9BACT|nr:hypothetical protein [Candidatus Scalindua arabica]
MIKNIRLTREEKEIEDSLINGEFINIEPDEFKEIANLNAENAKEN